MYADLQNAIQALAGRCDFAQTDDGQGFNGCDAMYGHLLADSNNWSPTDAWAAYHMLRKYRGQLECYGIDYDSLACPERPETGGTSSVRPPKVKKQAASKSQYPRREPAPYQDPTLRLDNNVFVFRFDFRHPDFMAIKEAIRNIQGRRWNPEVKCWTAPANSLSVEAVLSVAHDYDFAVDPEVEEVAGRLAAEAATMVAASRAESSEFTIAGLAGELRPFQRAGVEYASRAKRLIIGDEMGLGKTVQGIATVKHLDAFPAVFVCPQSIKINWKREIERWIPGYSIEVLNGKPGGYRSQITVVNYDNLSKHVEVIKAMRPRSVVFDEFHYCKNYKAQRSQAAKEIAKGVEVRIGLTGTPVLNRVAEVINLLSILDRLDDVGGFRHVMYDVAAAFNNGYGIEFGEQDPVKVEELNARMRTCCYVRREKKQVLKELPAKTRTDVWLQIDNQAAYQRAEYQVAHGKGGSAEHLTRITALRQLAAQGKLAAVKEWVENFLDSGEKLVLFAHHIEVQEALAAEFPGCAMVRGEDPVEVRQANVDRFQNDPDTKLIVCSLKAAAVGITLTAASNVAFVELGWTPGDMMQAEDRVHRIGQQNSVTAWYLLAEGTIDSDMNDLINQKAIITKALAEGNKLTEEEQARAKEGMIGALLDRLKDKNPKKVRTRAQVQEKVA